MKVAIVHDWLNGMRGGERCLEIFLDIYPQADIFTLLHVRGATSAKIDNRVRATSFIQSIPAAKKLYRLLLPIYPSAVAGFDFKGYDLVISLSHAAAKNIRVPKAVPHLCYCFTPMRYIWDQVDTYFGALRAPLWPVIKSLRSWDSSGSKSVTAFASISNFIAARIRLFYSRRAAVIYPPVDVSWITPAKQGSQGDYFLYAGALVPYKRADLVIKAFSKLESRLLVIGKGPEEKKLQALAGSNIEFLGHVSDQQLAEYYTNSRALIFPGKEDFGMIPVECLAAGRPVIGLYDGGLSESLIGIKPWLNSHIDNSKACGVFFRQAKDERAQLASLTSSIYYFIEHEEQFQVANCRQRALQFSPARFFQAWQSFSAAYHQDFGLEHSRVEKKTAYA